MPSSICSTATDAHPHRFRVSAHHVRGHLRGGGAADAARRRGQLLGVGGPAQGHVLAAVHERAQPARVGRELRRLQPRIRRQRRVRGGGELRAAARGVDARRHLPRARGAGGGPVPAVRRIRERQRRVAAAAPRRRGRAGQEPAALEPAHEPRVAARRARGPRAAGADARAADRGGGDVRADRGHHGRGPAADGGDDVLRAGREPGQRHGAADGGAAGGGGLQCVQGRVAGDAGADIQGGPGEAVMSGRLQGLYGYST